MICKYIYSDKARQGRKRGNKIAPISHTWVRFPLGLCTVTITCLPYLLVNCICDDFLLLLLCFNLCCNDLFSLCLCSISWHVSCSITAIPHACRGVFIIELSLFGAVMMVWNANVRTDIEHEHQICTIFLSCFV
eukprot:490782_1